MDWNWFFSSLSQSAAAIVGVFGAFIITKILTNQATFAAKGSRRKELVAGAEKIRDAANVLRFNWYNRWTNDDEFKRIEKILKDDPDTDAEAIYDALNFSEYVPRATVVSQIQVRLQARRQRLAREQEERNRRASETSGFFPMSAHATRMDEIMAAITPQSHIDAMVKEQDAIEKVVGDARHHIRLTKDFLDTVHGNPESSSLISKLLLMITLLFFAGVIYPLSWMPISGAPIIDWSLKATIALVFSLKGLLLLAVSLVFSYALYTFHLLNEVLKYAPADIDELQALTEMGAYAKEFQIMEANQLARPAREDKPPEADEAEEEEDED